MLYGLGHPAGGDHLADVERRRAARTRGDGAVIAGGAFVNRDVAPYTIVAGTPARVVRTRFDTPLIEQLLARGAEVVAYDPQAMLQAQAVLGPRPHLYYAPQADAALAGADALVSTDTGPSHMAAALGIPVVSVFGPTQPRQTGPFDDGRNFVQILSARLPCSPCVGTPAFQSCANNVCMAAVTPDMVAASVWRLIRSRQAAPESRAVPN